MNFLKNFLVILLLVFIAGAGFSASTTDKQKPVKDLSRAYEVWKNKGIKFVVRDKKGKFASWSVGRLESWDKKSKWVVRDQKGRFITHAYGRVENWKNGQTRLVIRDPKGRLLTHIDVKLTSKSSFASTVVGLRRLKNDKFLSFVQESLSDIINDEIEDGEYSKARVLMTYLKKHKGEKGVPNFKPVIRKIIPALVFESNDNPDNKKIQNILHDAQKLLKEL